MSSGGGIEGEEETDSLLNKKSNNEGLGSIAGPWDHDLSNPSIL